MMWINKKAEIIERNYSKWFLTPVKRTINDYEMIKEGDKIALAVSGGGDSSALLYILSLVKAHAPVSFSLQAIFVDLGWEMDVSPLEELCRNLGIPLHKEKTLISRIVFEEKKEKNPCSLCAKLRRGALHNTALKLGCNRVALGHHLNDSMETFFLNLLYSGKLDTFKPTTFLGRSQLYLIRPLISIPANTLSSLTKKEKLPVINNPCPVSGGTRREVMNEIVNFILSRYPQFYDRFITAMEKHDIWPREPYVVNSRS